MTAMEVYLTRFGLQSAFPPSAVPLWTTPRRYLQQDAIVFPRLHARCKNVEVPHFYHTWAHRKSSRARIELDGFFVPELLATQLSNHYGHYLRWWLAKENPQRRLFRSSIVFGTFHDHVWLRVLREDAPWWIAYLDACAPYTYAPGLKTEAEAAWEAHPLIVKGAR